MARLRATAHPVRLRILSLLTAEAMSAAEVARALDLTHANASYHLRLLHDIGELVVESEEKIRGGRAKRYRYDAAREVPDRTSGVDDRIAYARANALEVERRLRDAVPGGGSSSDLEAWVPVEAWRRASTSCTRPPTCCTPRPAPPGLPTRSTSAPRPTRSRWPAA